MKRLICLAADALGSVPAIVIVPIVCFMLSRWLSNDALTLALSIAAITFTQLILYASDKDTKALHAKLDGLVRVSEAPDDLIGVETA